jgi:hypothetical protein
MTRFLFAAVAAIAFFTAQPVLACEDCKNCPHKVADADKKPAADKAPAAGCACAGQGKECKCGEKCACAHCGAHKAGEKKDEAKKS